MEGREGRREGWYGRTREKQAELEKEGERK